MNRLFLSVFALAAFSVGWTIQPSGTRASFRGLSVVDAKTVWVSGSRGKVLHTTDGGSTWKLDSIAGADSLDLRDVQAFDAKTAVAISAGPAEKGQAKIFRTTDSGATWTTVFTTDQKGVFFDALSFWDARHGIVLSDPVGSKLFLLVTDDGGATWTRVPPDGMPDMLPSESAFAASGTCLTVQGPTNAWIATGGGAVGRVFRSTDRGRTWTVAETPVHSGDGGAAGIFSVAFTDASNGVVVGGNYSQPKTPYVNVALTSDGGVTWRAPAGPNPPGYLSAVTYIPGTNGRTLVATGLVGTAISVDGGERWSMADTVGYNAVAFVAVEDAGWAVGDRGRIAKWTGRVDLSIPVRKP
jgi:photosystem II stability/assembly factor-like uncharacterized protein